MAKVLKIVDADGVEKVGFACPGCGFDHILPFSRRHDGSDSSGPCWGWNGSEHAPTITPSIRMNAPTGPGESKVVCHSFVTDGRIQFLSDCTHALAGQTVELPDLAAAFLDFWSN